MMCGLAAAEAAEAACVVKTSAAASEVCAGPSAIFAALQN
eukprot:SAG31_NODE_2118_length_6410_cov_3.846142_8_plen_40_part_00